MKLATAIVSFILVLAAFVNSLFSASAKSSADSACLIGMACWLLLLAGCAAPVTHCNPMRSHCEISTGKSGGMVRDVTPLPPVPINGPSERA